MLTERKGRPLLTLSGPFVRGTMIGRPNRFTVIAEINGEVVKAYLPNPGRLPYLVPGARLLVARKSGGKLSYEVFLAFDGDVPVTVDSRLANRVFESCVSKGYLRDLRGYGVEREVTIDGSKIDFLLRGKEGAVYVEVKSCTYVDRGTAMFPDRQTERGRRHLRLLQGLRERGHDCAIVFVIQRPDARLFAPFREVDPGFAGLLKEALGRGLMGISFSTLFDVDSRTIYFLREVPVSV